MTTQTEVLERVSTPARRWTIDPERSTVEFRVPTFWGLHTVVGHFERFEGYYLDRPETAVIELTIDARSLDTGNALRDRHLRSEEFFDADAHPEIRFHSTRIGDLGGTLAVTGTLEIGTKSVPLAFDAKVEPDGAALEIDATMTVDQRDLGMTRSPLRMIRTPTVMRVRGRLVSDEPDRRPGPGKESTMNRKPKKPPELKAPKHLDEAGERAEKDADLAAQAQITSIAAALGARWDGSDWVPLDKQR